MPSGSVNEHTFDSDVPFVLTETEFWAEIVAAECSISRF